mgnify:CR=1 FL=1
MEQDYATVCKEGDLVMGEKYNYNSSLIMISMKPKPGFQRIVNCLTIDEIMRSLSQDQRFLRHGPIEISRVNERNALSPELRSVYIRYTDQELKEIRNFKQSQVEDKSTWIYRLPILQETYVDASIIQCIKERKNSIELINPVSVLLYQSQGRSGLHDEYRSVYSAIPISRCEMLSNPMNCDETSTFEEDNNRNSTEEKEIVESVPELDAETLKFLEEQRERNNRLLMNRRKGKTITTIEGDYKTPIRVQTTYDDDGNVSTIERFESDVVDMYHHDEKTPSYEAYHTENRKEKRWNRGVKNINNPFFHRLTGPAIIIEQDNAVIFNKWYNENKLSRQDGPAMSLFYKDSGRPLTESYFINDVKTRNTVDYFDIEKSPIMTVYKNINNYDDFEMYYAPSDEVIQSTNLEKALFPGQQLFIEKHGNTVNIYSTSTVHTPITIEIHGNTYFVSWNINETFQRTMLSENNNITTMISNRGQLSKSLSSLSNRTVVSRSYYIDENAVKIEKHWKINGKDLVLDNSIGKIKKDNYSDFFAVKVFNSNKSSRELLSYNLGALQEVKEMSPEKLLFIGFPIILYNDFENKFEVFNYEERKYPYRRPRLPAIILNGTCKKVMNSDTGATLDIECKEEAESIALDNFRPNMEAIRKRDIMDKKWVMSELKLQFRLKYFIDNLKQIDYIKTLKIPQMFLEIDETFIDRISGNYLEYDENLYFEK